MFGMCKCIQTFVRIFAKGIDKRLFGVYYTGTDVLNLCSILLFRRYLMKKAETAFRRLVVMALLLVLFVLFAENRLLVVQAGERSVPSGFCCTSVKISEQDTLERFAERYNVGLYDSNETYVETVRRMNGMYNDRLRPGCYLAVICRLP